jgi:hypothetical protein
VIGLCSDLPGNNQRCGLQFGTNFGTSRGALRRASRINAGDSSGFAQTVRSGQVKRPLSVAFMSTFAVGPGRSAHAD